MLLSDLITEFLEDNNVDDARKIATEICIIIDDYNEKLNQEQLERNRTDYENKNKN